MVLVISFSFSYSLHSEVFGSQFGIINLQDDLGIANICRDDLVESGKKQKVRS